MRKAIVMLGIARLSASSNAGAQPRTDCAPSAPDIPGAPYPCVLPDNRLMTFSEPLTEAGITNVYFASPGTAHEWLTWRRCLGEFAPRLFL